MNPSTQVPGSHSSGKPLLTTSRIVGIVAFVFLVIGYQAALFVGRASQLRILANRDRPDTVYLVDAAAVEAFLSRLTEEEILLAQENSGDSPGPGPAGSGRVTFRKTDAAGGRHTAFRRNAPHSEGARAVVDGERKARRKVESFRFNPNTVSIEDLVRLGFSEKQAEAIDHYRQKGGRFRRKADFAKSYVVADSVYQRLEPFIDIPLLDLNRADSAALTALPGIGPFYAGKIVAYRRELGGYSFKEQLLDLYRFDREKYDGLEDLITVGPSKPYPLWTLPEDSLKMHPYIRTYAAHGIVLFRSNSPREDWTVENLISAGILKPDSGEKLARCRIAQPGD